MDGDGRARLWFGLTALAILVGLVVQIFVTLDYEGGFFTSDAARVFNVFCFFTVQSNILVMVTCALLAVRLDRTSVAFAAVRLAAIVDIAITGVVFHLALSNLQDLEGNALLADTLLHTVSPLAAVGGWLLYGPRGLTSWRIVRWAMVIPVAWVVFTLIRGPLVRDYYPYPFVDVAAEGYLRVGVNLVIIGVLFFALAAGAMALDKRLPDRRPSG